MKLLWAALGLTACTAVGPPQPALALRFAWPAQGSVQVRETVTRKGHTAEYAYELAWAPHPEGGFVLEQRDRRWTALDGEELAGPPSPEALAAAGLNEAVLPRMWIGAGGEVTELLDMEALAEPLIRQAQANPALSDRERQEIAATMKSPAAVAMLGAASRQRWQCWVGAWLKGDGIVSGRPATRAQDIPTVLGGSARALVTSSAQPPERIGGRTLVRLRLDMVFDPESLLQAMHAVPDQALTARAQELQREAMESIARAERRELLEVLTDPATLMPRTARRRTETSVFDKNGASLGEQTEEFLFVFDWGDG